MIVPLVSARYTQRWYFLLTCLVAYEETTTFATIRLLAAYKLIHI